VIDGSGDSVIATVQCDQPPRFLCYDSAYNRVYCSISGSYVIVIDGTTDSITVAIHVGGGPRGLCFSPAHDRVYVANSMGSSISVIRNSAPGIEESFGLKVSGFKPIATVVRGVLFQPLGTVPIRGQSPCLLDASGRKVLDLKPGPNNVRALAPGAYFVREASGVEREASRVRKVVVTR